MKNVFMTLLLIGGCFQVAHAQENPSYRLFTSQGIEISYDKMLREMDDADIIMFGEFHDSEVLHKLELQLLQDVYVRYPDLVLAMEMFEADDQLVLNEYLSGLIEEKHLLGKAKIWSNYQEAYSPLVDFAQKNKVPLVASNIPNRYANMVLRKGLSALDSLSDHAKQFMAPLPVEVNMKLESYKNLSVAMEHHHMGFSLENFIQAQAVKDATMAHFINKHSTSSNKILHINGAYHSQNHEGIVWYLKALNKHVKIVTLQPIQLEAPEAFGEEQFSVGDFVIGIPPI